MDRISVPPFLKWSCERSARHFFKKEINRYIWSDYKILNRTIEIWIFSSIICVLPSKALFLFFRKWGDEFFERPKSGKTMRYRVESCFIRFGTPDLPHADLNRFLNKCNPEEVTSKRWKKVGFLPDFSRFFSEFFFVFSWAPSTNIFGGYKKIRFFQTYILSLVWKLRKNKCQIYRINISFEMFCI